MCPTIFNLTALCQGLCYCEIYENLICAVVRHCILVISVPHERPLGRRHWRCENFWQMPCGTARKRPKSAVSFITTSTATHVPPCSGCLWQSTAATPMYLGILVEAFLSSSRAGTHVLGYHNECNMITDESCKSAPTSSHNAYMSAKHCPYVFVEECCQCCIA